MTRRIIVIAVVVLAALLIVDWVDDLGIGATWIYESYPNDLAE